MKKWDSHQRNEDKEVEIMDFNQKTSKRNRSGAKPNKKQAKKKRRSINKEFAIVTYVFLALFIGMTGYFIYFIQVKSDDFINNSYNARLNQLQNYAIRGNILADDGSVLAQTTVNDDGSETRTYPYGSVFAHAVGYSINGMSGAELDANYYLLTSNSFILSRLANQVLDKKNQGDDVVTTLNVGLQQACYNAMGNNEGAAICIEPSTGKILSMVSKPDYDPNSIGANWDSYVAEDSDSTVLLNRATQGLYAPGSTFKIVTLLSYLQQNKSQDFQFNCTGAFSYDNYTMHCFNGKSHGAEDLISAFGNSCNSAFSQIGLGLDIPAFDKLCDKLLFNRQLPTQLKDTAKSRMTLSQKDGSSLVMQTAIGQGNTMVSPLHMAMIASAIANDGTLMKPYLLDYTQNESGTVIKHFGQETYGNLMSGEDAATMQQYMRYVVTSGTATPLLSEQYEAYGKTGTAEFGTDKSRDHSWFVGFAKDASGKEIAVAVVMEGVSAGDSHAVPVTKQILDAYFSM